MRFSRLSHEDLTAIVALMDDRESRRPLTLAAKLLRAHAQRELRRREAVTDQARAILRGD